jgi:hypothetical protein
MDKLLIHNMKNAKWVIGSLLFAHSTWFYCLTKRSLYAEVFGIDGSGGQMLKIVTDLTDEEMARLKYARRLQWHFRGYRSERYGKDSISDQELSDRGIENPQEPYVEYMKRPPHDKYL